MWLGKSTLKRKISSWVERTGVIDRKYIEVGIKG